MKSNVVEIFERTGGTDSDALSLLQIVLASIALQPALNISSIKTILKVLLEAPALSAQGRVEGMKLVQMLGALEDVKRDFVASPDPESGQSAGESDPR